ncbi:MAG: aminotransferase class I/II-fold pyridoxal phosphate-dependent enzyme [Bacteroidales bacterium]
MNIADPAEKGAAFVDRLYARANGSHVIDLAREYPVFEPPAALVRQAVEHTQTKSNLRVPCEGILPLRQSIASRLNQMYSHLYDPETEVTITAGGTQGMHTAISALVEEGDEVIVFEPAHEIYVPAILSNGGRPAYITLKKNHFRIDWEEVQKMINSRTRLIIINTPHNPTGTILSSFDMERLQKIIQGTRIRVISDEVFEHLIYEGFEHQSVARFPYLAENSLIVSSFGKSFHVSGWKIGYCAGPSALMEKFRRKQQFQIHSATVPFQYALNDYLIGEFSPAAVSQFYENKRNVFIEHLKKTGFKIIKPSGTFFILLDFEEISKQKDTEFAENLLEKKGILVLPLSVFHHDHYNQFLLRLCFARPEEQLTEAAAKLSE